MTEKRTNYGYAIPFLAFSLLAFLCVQYLRNAAPPMPHPQPAAMIESDRIKDEIRRKKAEKSAAEVGAENAAADGDPAKAAEWTQKARELGVAIDKLYEDLHEANVQEGADDKQ